MGLHIDAHHRILKSDVLYNNWQWSDSFDAWRSARDIFEGYGGTGISGQMRRDPQHLSKQKVCKSTPSLRKGEILGTSNCT